MDHEAARPTPRREGAAPADGADPRGATKGPGDPLASALQAGEPRASAEGPAGAAPTDADLARRMARQEATARVANRLALAGDARASVDHPELGRLEISARRHGGEIDVDLLARDPASVAVLRSAAPRLEQELRGHAVELRHLDIDQASTDEGAPRDREGRERPGQDAHHRDAHNRDAHNRDDRARGFTPARRDVSRDRPRGGQLEPGEPSLDDPPPARAGLRAVL